MLDRLEAAFERERDLRRRRQPRAAHAAGDPQGRARARAARRAARPSELERRAALGRRGDRPARPARRGPARDRALRPGPAADPARGVAAADVLEGVRARFARRAARHGAELRSARRRASRVDADPLRLEQALGNLVDNALRHGGGADRAGRRAPTATTVELHVRDDGARLPRRLLAQAFERFTRGDAARGRGGAGLGLAIVAAIAAHGGTDGAQPPRGRGRVWISRPEPASGRTPYRRRRCRR